MAENSGSTGSVTSIDTKDFDDGIAKFKSAIVIYRAARERIFTSTENLLISWEGKGKNAFEKEYTQLKSKLTDEEDNLNAIKEDLENCLQSYLDWDTELTGALKAAVTDS